MATINQVLSDNLKVAPLKPGEYIKFRLLKLGQLDPQTDEPIVIADYWQSGKEVIFDAFSKKGNKNVLLLNATSIRIVDNKDGTSREEAIVSHIKWDSTGEVLFGADQYETICFMRRSNKNKSNVFRNPLRKAIYEEVNEQQIIDTRLYDENMELDARLWVRDAKIDELKAMAENLGMTFSNDKLDSLRISMLEKVKKDPKAVMISSSNTKVKKKIQVMDAERYEIIFFEPTERHYFYKDNLKRPICHVPLSESKVDGLLAFFATEDGKVEYVKFAAKVRTLYQAKVA